MFNSRSCPRVQNSVENSEIKLNDMFKRCRLYSELSDPFGILEILFLCRSNSFNLVSALKGSMSSIKLNPNHTVLNPDKTLISEMSVRRLCEQSRISNFGSDIKLSNFVIVFLSKSSIFNSSSPSSKGIFLNCL